MQNENAQNNARRNKLIFGLDENYFPDYQINEILADRTKTQRFIWRVCQFYSNSVKEFHKRFNSFFFIKSNAVATINLLECENLKCTVQIRKLKNLGSIYF